MKLVAAIKLLPTPEQALCLKNTLIVCNDAATWLAQKGFDAKVFGQYALHNMAYYRLREGFGLAAQAAVRTIAKVADAFKINKTIAPVFRTDAAQPYDHNIIRFIDGVNAVSIWTIEGRIKIPIVMGEHQRRLLEYRKGEIDLCLVRGKWYLAATCDVPETEPFNAEDWLGVDFGLVNIATDSDGKIYSGQAIESHRRHIQERRRGLQKCGTKAAKRRLKKLSGKQRRYQHHISHRISKALVADAKRTGRGIALEQLKGIHSRVTARNSEQRARLTNWSFGRLSKFISYKAKQSGVPVVFVDPRNTSLACSLCGCIDKRNRPNQATFQCISCWHMTHADYNAACNIRQLGFASQGNGFGPLSARRVAYVG